MNEEKKSLQPTLLLKLIIVLGILFLIYMCSDAYNQPQKLLSLKVIYTNGKIDTLSVPSKCIECISIGGWHDLYVDGEKVALGVKSFSILGYKRMPE